MLRLERFELLFSPCEVCLGCLLCWLVVQDCERASGEHSFLTTSRGQCTHRRDTDPSGGNRLGDQRRSWPDEEKAWRVSHARLRVGLMTCAYIHDVLVHHKCGTFCLALGPSSDLSYRPVPATRRAEG